MGLDPMLANMIRVELVKEANGCVGHDSSMIGEDEDGYLYDKCCTCGLVIIKTAQGWKKKLDINEGDK